MSGDMEDVFYVCPSTGLVCMTIGMGGKVYLTPAEANALSAALEDAARKVKLRGASCEPKD